MRRERPVTWTCWWSSTSLALEYARLQRKLEEILGAVKVDLVMRRAVLDELKEEIYAEAVDAF